MPKLIQRLKKSNQSPEQLTLLIVRENLTTKTLRFKLIKNDIIFPIGTRSVYKNESLIVEKPYFSQFQNQCPPEKVGEQ